VSESLGDADTISGVRALATNPEGDTLLPAAAEAAPQAIRTGTELGHFVIERVLGRGAMGVVYLPRQPRPFTTRGARCLSIPRHPVGRRAGVRRLRLPAHVIGCAEAVRADLHARYGIAEGASRPCTLPACVE
jgi:hypothetical protein